MQLIQVVYYVLPLLGGHIGIPISLATIFFARNQSKRDPTYISFLISWSVFATSDLILLYAGQEIESPSKPPPHTLCLIQACLIYARFVLVSTTTFTLTFTLWLDVRIHAFRNSLVIRALLLWAPWVFFAISLVVFLVYASLNPSALATEGIFYCNFVTNDVCHTPGDVELFQAIQAR
ncbi:hypothetical protein SCHPADRAFT_346163 [Schizopora paradoxa]|uniref:G-protein coupled receptors family 1 profile domain-containing protein n=1 Tax=Schizopora paradoxa TaxID=27342 RepID=A0A0H2RWG1_9AGAM|nr:hypothetical protein SCHPADRAFT_346163 [Schizopora paradoxa]